MAAIPLEFCAVQQHIPGVIGVIFELPSSQPILGVSSLDLGHAGDSVAPFLCLRCQEALR